DSTSCHTLHSFPTRRSSDLRLRPREQRHRRLRRLPAPQDRRAGRAPAPAHGAGRRIRPEGGAVRPLSIRVRLTLWYTGLLLAIRSEDTRLNSSHQIISYAVF